MLLNYYELTKKVYFSPQSVPEAWNLTILLKHLVPGTAEAPRTKKDPLKISEYISVQSLVLI